MSVRLRQPHLLVAFQLLLHLLRRKKEHGKDMEWRFPLNMISILILIPKIKGSNTKPYLSMGFSGRFWGYLPAFHISRKGLLDPTLPQLLPRAHSCELFRSQTSADEPPGKGVNKVRPGHSQNSYPLVNEHSHWKLIFIVDFPIKNCDFP